MGSLHQIERLCPPLAYAERAPLVANKFASRASVIHLVGLGCSSHRCRQFGPGTYMLSATIILLTHLKGWIVLLDRYLFSFQTYNRLRANILLRIDSLLYFLQFELRSRCSAWLQDMSLVYERHSVNRPLSVGMVLEMCYGYMKVSWPQKIPVIFIWLTPRKTEFFVVVLVWVEKLGSISLKPWACGDSRVQHPH